MLQTAKIANAPGHISASILCGHDDSNELVVIEERESIDNHQAAAANIPAEQIGMIMPLLATPPKGVYYSNA